MATLTEKIDMERRVRDWLDENAVPQPSSVEFGYTCIRLFWEDTKVVLVVDVDELPQDGLGLSLQELGG